jgi:glycosyltransferase involved in cell wall biosynthesis
MEYSVVVPLKDEEENIEPLIEEIESAMKNLSAPWELICVDDGSKDQTLSLLQRLQKGKPFLRIVAFDKNYGQSSAFDAGFKSARGQFIITLDGDRQNDPADIPKLIALKESCDLVCGRRLKRQDSLLKKFLSFIANHVRSRLCGDGIKDTGCSLKLYRAECLKKIKLFHGMHRFLPALFLIEGFRVKEVPVNHRKREKGQTKYNFFNRSLNTIADMFAVRWMRKRCLRYQVKQ